MDLCHRLPLFYQPDGSRVGPAGKPDVFQCRPKAHFVGLCVFLSFTCASALLERGSETSPVGVEFLKAQEAIAQTVVVSELAQAFQGSVAAGEESVQVGFGREVDVFGVHNFRGARAWQAQ